MTAVSVWDIDLDPRTPAGGWGGQLLDAADRRRAAALADPVAARALARSRAAARRLLAGHLGLPASQIHWDRGENGKPAVPGRTCEWNLSRSGDRALVAIGGLAPVGVDLQREHPHRDPVALARRYFGPAEAERVAAAADPVRLVCRLLSRKEALAKAAGGRLLAFLRCDTGRVAAAPVRWCGEQLTVTDLDAGPGYTAALAVQGAGPDPISYRTCHWRTLCTAG